jgi:DNA uptake protein ComE-like DNA-binding protein
MRFIITELAIGKRITLCGDSPADRVLINGGENYVEPEVWEVLKNDPTILHHLEAKTLLLLDEQPSAPVEPAAESLDEIGYVPLTPTADQLTPLPKVGAAKAASIIENTPEGGYTSPGQLVVINSLSIDVSLVEALFEIA